MSTLEQEGEEVVGQARCPFESRQSNVGLFAGELEKIDWMLQQIFLELSEIASNIVINSNKKWLQIILCSMWYF